MLTVATSWMNRLFPRSIELGLTARRRHRRRQLALADRTESLEPRCLLSATVSEVGTLPATGLEKFQSRDEIRVFVLDQLHTRWADTFGTHGQYVDSGCGHDPQFAGLGNRIASPIATGLVAIDYPICRRNADDALVATPTGGETNPSPRLNATGDHSATNNQVPGVEEADLVQTDGQFLYILSGHELLIMDAQSTGQLAVASRTRIDGTPVVQFLHGDRLTVISRQNDEFVYPFPVWSMDAIASDVWNPPRSRLLVSIFNVTNRSHPELVHETLLDGELVQARAVGDQDYVIVRNSTVWTAWYDDRLAPQAEYTRTTTSVDGQTQILVEYSYETWDEYRMRLLSGPDLVDNVLPGIYRTDAVLGTVPDRLGLLSDPNDIVRPIVTDPMNLLTVVQFDVGAILPILVDTETVFTGYGNHVFATAEDMYVTSFGYETGAGDHTDIFQLSLQPSSVEITATGLVSGTVLNQFSMDEFAGHFRIATTIGRSDGWRFIRTNAVFVLDTAGPTLDVVGQLTDVAPGEQLMSARFVGDRAYVVTFLQVDPLFVIDLSDPTAPTVLGELKIPGFSQYLHPIGNDQVLGIGREVGVWRGGLQVSVFNVSQADHPDVLSQLLVTSAGDWTGVPDGTGQFDHHAVSYFPESRILALPVRQGPHWWWWSDADRGATRFQPYALKVLQIDEAGGTHLLGEIAHEYPIVRSLRIGDRLYSISRERVWRENGTDDHLVIKVHQLNDPTVRLGELSLVNNERTAFQPPVVVPVIRGSSAHPPVLAGISTAFAQDAVPNHSTARLPDPVGLTSHANSRLPSLVTARQDDRVAVRISQPQAVSDRPVAAGKRATLSTTSIPNSVTRSGIDELWTDFGTQLGTLANPLHDLFDRPEDPQSDAVQSVSNIANRGDDFPCPPVPDNELSEAEE